MHKHCCYSNELKDNHVSFIGSELKTNNHTFVLQGGRGQWTKAQRSFKLSTLLGSTQYTMDGRTSRALAPFDYR